MVGLLIAIAAVVAACVGLLVGMNVGGSRRINNLKKSAYEDFDKQVAELAQRAQAREGEHASAVVAAQRDLAAVHREAAEVRKQADAQAVQIREQAASAATVEMDRARRIRDEAEAETRVLKDDIRELRLDLERREARQAEREERLDADLRRTADKERELAAADAELERKRAELATLEDERRAILERAAALSAGEAKTELVKSIENQAKREAAVLIRQIEQEARDEGDKRARKTVALAIQRVASEQTAESVVSVLHLPSDDMKGRIIGREGRNIRAYESITGVNLIIDDSPEAVLLSCFDPVRREVGRLTLEELVLDGRIHPHRIEEIYERSKAKVETLCVRAGEDALMELGITDMHPELIALLGKLRYRTSYGQNVLKHLVESAHLASIMASELRLDPVLLKRCTVLHDIGKALTHEVEGSHALIGAEIARKYGEHDDVVHAIEAHHNEVEVRTVEAVLTQAADAISGGRPGARRESLEAYVKRLERLEQIAAEQEGVEKVFAMQAGREIRVMVVPDAVDDIQAQVIARDIAKQVEEELTYPGQIRITVVRESRATEYAR
ncbi:RNA binding metal dependent phosphohydrolase [Catenulispora acidiphila DSM 44928]|uniref:Ribonuclease Y n=2 Tax=Catenulispora TaxID=414878 RepID=C7QAA6_CATAD|nr:ribonuclease Y [Catenulispora acidiphila]ACU70504.1 RNA binding metal dependent phosphohydrolase [Catenulispora acidiphila DSM 44928]